MTNSGINSTSFNSSPSYNLKQNPSIFNYKGNNVERLNYLRQILLSISFNQDYLLIVLGLKNMGRSYYNQPSKKFCSTIRLNKVENFGGKHITVYLPSPGGILQNSIEYVKYNNTTKTPLMRVLEKQKLPTCWSNNVLGGTGNCDQISVNPTDALTELNPNEQVIYFYIKNADFFTRVLKLLVSSFYNNAIQRYECYTLTLPSDLYAGTHVERTYTVTGDFLRSVYSTFLRSQRLGSSLKLPAPLNIDNTYDLETTTYTKKELIHQMNNNTNGSVI
mgnify:CR=1 FL=1|jgi:hypothetical protein